MGLAQAGATVGHQQPASIGVDGERCQDALCPPSDERVEQGGFVAITRATALNQVRPATVGTDRAVDQGRRCGCSTGPVIRSPSHPSWSSTQASTAARQSGSSHLVRAVRVWRAVSEA
jgi:hypothetical protein